MEPAPRTNPLLSSAVTGLSLQELSPRALLLPAPAPDFEKDRPENAPLGNTVTSNNSKLKANNSNKPPLSNRNVETKSITPVTPAVHRTDASSKNLTESKALPKTDDDFDVNEYFARLQSTRYVSAPKDLREDKNANLEETEENLEEINLLDDSRSNSSPHDEFQQSLTADIAQNFSQLPQVLPQVANAVFSSFSNILNLNKSRDATPVTDSNKYAQQDYGHCNQGYGVQGIAYAAQEMQAQNEGYTHEAAAVPMFRPDNVAGLNPSREERPTVAGPPPIGGPTNTFRISSKKKTYAHIPGLSTSESHTTSQVTPFSVNLPLNPPSWANQANTSSQFYNPQNTPDTYSSPIGSSNTAMINPSYSTFASGTSMQDTNATPIFSSSSAAPAQLPLPSPETAVLETNANPSFYTPISSSSAGVSDPTTSLKQPPPTQISSSATLDITDCTSTDAKHVWKPNLEPSSACSAVMTEISDTQLTKDLIPKYEEKLATLDLNESENKLSSAYSGASEIHDVYTGKTGESNKDLSAPPAHQSSEVSGSLQQSNIEPPPTSLPPPPMLPPPIGLPPRNTSSVDRSILPPSVARRLTSTHSTSKTISDLNIFVPRPLLKSNTQSIDSTSFFSESSIPLISNEGLQTFTPPKPENAIPKGLDTPSLLIPAPVNDTITSNNLFIQPSLIAPTNIFTSLSTENTIGLTQFGSGENSLSIYQPITPQTSNEQVPTFFNPSAIGQNVNFTSSSNTYGVPSTHDILSTPVLPTNQGLPTNKTSVPPNSVICQPIEEPKPLIKEPPKLPPNVQNFRLGNKKKQYYSGPIEGTGHIGNMVVPTLDPVLPTQNTVSNVALFTPTLDPSKSTNQEESLTVTQAPFDLGQPHGLNQTQAHADAPFDLRCSNLYEPQDLSSSHSNVSFGHKNHNEPQHCVIDDSKSDLFGSLKSKLSSVNINKFQNAVTSLFDPAYYETGKNDENTNNFGFGQSHPNTENYDHSQMQTAQSYDYGNTQSLNLDIFIPNVEQQHQQSYQTYVQYHQNQQNYLYTPDQNYYQTTTPQSAPTQGNFQNPSQQSWQIPSSQMCYGQNTDPQKTPNIPHLHSGIPDEAVAQQAGTTAWPDSQQQGATNTVRSSNAYLEKDSSIKFFNPFGQPGNKRDEDQIGQLQWDKTKQSSASLGNKCKTTAKQTEGVNISGIEAKDDIKIETLVRQNPIDFFGSAGDVHSKISSIETATELSERRNSNKGDIHSNINNRQDSRYDKNTSSITAQLIENLTAPIQLFNPVHVPLNENNTSIGKENRTVDTNQFDEISQITEDTIDSIQTQAFDKREEGGDTIKDNESNMFFDNAYGYGWSVKPEDKQNCKEHDNGISDPNVIGVREGTLTVPPNTSNDVKEVLHNSQEETEMQRNHAYLIRQMSIPSAPSAAELGDTETEYNVTKDDADFESILDVNLIEQDAKSDVDEIGRQSIESQDSRRHLIEQWETGDAKFEQEKSVDAVVELRNSVFGFESAYSTIVEPEISPRCLSSEKVTSPAVSFASYFDTGNYAAENHFKNSSNPLIISSNTQNVIGFRENEEGIIQTQDISYIGFRGQEFGDTDNMLENTTPDIQGHFVLPSENIIELPKSSIEETDDEIDTKLVRTSQPDFDIVNPINSQVDNPPDSTTYFETIQGSKNCTSLASDVTEEVNIAAQIKSSELFEKVIDLPKPKFEDTTLITDGVEITNLHCTERKGIFGTETKTVDVAKLENLLSAQQLENKPSLPDPIQFFGQPQETSLLQETQPEGSYNLLASYFATPSVNTSQRPDPKRSFFELSEGQDHYMHETQISGNLKSYLAPDPPYIGEHQESAHDYYNVPLTRNEHLDFKNPETFTSFFELSQSENHYMDDMKYDMYKCRVEDTEKINDVPINKIDINDFCKTSVRQTFDNSAQFNINSTKFVGKVELIDKIKNLDDDSKTHIKTSKLDTAHNSLELKVDGNKAEFTTIKFSQYEENNFGIDINSGAEIEESFTDYESRLAAIINNCDHCGSVITISKKSVDLESGVPGVTIKSVTKSDIGFECEAKAVFNCEPNSDTVFDCEDNSDIVFGLEAMDADGIEKHKEGEVNLRSKAGSSGKGARQSVTFEDLQEEDYLDHSNSSKDNADASQYRPVRHHWFYRLDREGKSQWRPFSTADSGKLEEAYNSPTLKESTVVATDGGRYDVSVMERKRSPVYWTDKPTNVRRCSWFYKGTTDARYVPYTETVADLLEEEYRRGCATAEWHRRISLPGGESVVMHGASVMVHFLPGASPDSWGNTPQSVMRPRVVRRGVDDSEIEEGEPSRVDHLLLLCHGIGSACDLRFRPVEEVVDDFRATSLQLIQSHYRNSYESNKVGRIEVLPVSWHSTLHSVESGLDQRLSTVTLESIPKLRNFTNDTVLDVLFYTSPVFCQTIMNTVGSEMNRIYKLFAQRNPEFAGGVSLGGHSLGSLILFDLLCHQDASRGKHDKKASGASSESNDATCNVKYIVGSAGTGQPYITYPHLEFSPCALYALGSPIAIFQCIRGVDTLGEEFRLPTCPAFFNIFHPYDPVAYRIEPLIRPELQRLPPSLIPHHKGRKRMHLELKETMARVGADIRQRLTESLRSTWANVWRSPQPPPTDQLQQVIQEQLDREQPVVGGEDAESPEEEEGTAAEASGAGATDERLGRLNGGRRVDHVLQEAPFEIFNEYLFAMTSHVCYWESEDTMLLILREIYNGLGVAPDSVVPQQTMTLEVQRPSPPESQSSKTPNKDEPSTSSS